MWGRPRLFREVLLNLGVLLGWSPFATRGPFGRLLQLWRSFWAVLVCFKTSVRSGGFDSKPKTLNPGSVFGRSSLAAIGLFGGSGWAPPCRFLSNTSFCPFHCMAPCFKMNNNRRKGTMIIKGSLRNLVFYGVLLPKSIDHGGL